jgi:hypothetical protein
MRSLREWRCEEVWMMLERADRNELYHRGGRSGKQGLGLEVSGEIWGTICGAKC